MKKIKKSFILTLVCCFLISGIPINAKESEVSVSVINKPVVDITLASKETNVNIDTFENDLRKKMQELGVDDSLFRFSTVEREYSRFESTDLDFKNAVNNWTTIGAPTWQSNGNQISCKITGGQTAWNIGEMPAGSKTVTNDANLRWKDLHTTTTAWWGGALINPNIPKDAEKYNYKFRVEKNGNLHNGFCFNVVDHGNGRVSGYFMCLTYHLYYGPDRNSLNIAGYNDNNGTVYNLVLWRFDNYKIDSSFNVQHLWCCPNYPGVTPNLWRVPGTSANTIPGRITNLTTWAYRRVPGGYANYDVIYDKGNITIKVDGNVVARAFDNTYQNGSYGFYTMNCERQEPMYINDFESSIERKFIKTYEQVLREPKWRDEAHHIVVNVDDKEDISLTGENTEGEILSRTLNDKIHFIQWGTDANKEDVSEFISRNENNGLFVDNSDYDTCINETALYIKNLIEQTKENQYVLVNEVTDINVLPESLKTNASSEDYPNGRWFIHHDYEYFDNNEGLSSETEVYSPDLLCNFDKPGKYSIYFDDQLVKEVYAHRRPDAGFHVEILDENINIVSKSYDLDSNEDIGFGPGIESEKWFYKEINGDYKEGKPETYETDKTYVIKHEVTDKQGVSAYETKYVGKGKPIADFDIPDKVIKGMPLTITDKSYDPKGLLITEYAWELRKDDGLKGIYTENLPDINTSLTPGKYTLTLVVKNEAEEKSEPYTKTFSIINDSEAPSIYVDPTSCEWKHDQDINIYIKDSLSGLKNWQYIFTNSQTAPTAGYSELLTESIKTINIDKNGRNYLHIKAFDNAGNSIIKTFGIYYIDNIKPDITSAKKNHIYDNNTVDITLEAYDSLSGISMFGIAEENNPEAAIWDEKNILNVTKNGTYYLFVKDKVGNISDPQIITVTEITTKVIVNINWNDNHNKHLTRPDGTMLHLYQNGEWIKDYLLQGSEYGDLWTYTFDELQAKDTDGNDYKYAVYYDKILSEKAPSDGYKTSENIQIPPDALTCCIYNINPELCNVNIPSVNTPEPPKDDIISPYGPDPDTEEIGYTIKGSLYWIDNNDKLGYRPKKVLLTVLKDGELFTQATVTINSDKTDYKFTNLPKYNDSKEVFQYTIIESFDSWYVVDGKPFNVYTIDNDTKNDVYINGNKYGVVNFTNTLKLAAPDTPIIHGTSDYKVDIYFTHNQPKEINLTLKMFETFLDEEGNESYGNYNGNEYHLPVDMIGSHISLPAGKYEITCADSNYIIDNITIDGNYVRIKDGYLYVEKKNDDISAEVNITLTQRNLGYQDKQKRTNYFKIKVNTRTTEINKMNLFNVSDILVPENNETDTEITNITDADIIITNEFSEETESSNMPLQTSGKEGTQGFE